MNIEYLLMTCCGFEKAGEDQFRLYVTGPVPKPQLHRRYGERTPLFHLFAGPDAGRIEAWLARNRAWQCLRIPTYDRAKGLRAVLTADRWRGGDGSALSDFGRDRLIHDHDHRERLRTEVELLVGMVLGNPVRPGELEELHELQDTINAAPLGTELCTAAEVSE